MENEGEETKQEIREEEDVEEEEEETLAERQDGEEKWGMKEWNGFISGREEAVAELKPGEIVTPLQLSLLCLSLPEIKDLKEVDQGRFIQYRFSPAFLSLKEIGATLEFMVGSRAVNRFSLIERHYFRDLILKTFDFEIGYCIPHSRNTCEHIYSLPDLDADIVGEMISNPFETRTDSFYFANNRLIMHNKAEYSFSEGGGTLIALSPQNGSEVQK
ncbi:protein unc-119 homolog [Esox lucius]|uniref:protein unc-119 homolog n=1 Tax=Esox lucius TaxID=8010 RepID=UPI001476BA32|nr:protein unc-119 homolog [Esox lucius]